MYRVTVNYTYLVQNRKLKTLKKQKTIDPKPNKLDVTHVYLNPILRYLTRHLVFEKHLMLFYTKIKV